MSDRRQGRVAARLIRVGAALVALAAVCGPSTPVPAAPASCPQELAGRIPPRPHWALGGSEFLRWTAGLSEHDREFHLAAELLAGNLPQFVRRLQPVILTGRVPGGRTVEVTICVTPDYVALGPDRDFVRMPMALPTALALAQRFGFILPTPRMVDAIYAEAAAHLTPQPLPPTDAMRSNMYTWWHQRRIHRQRVAKHIRLGTLMAGHKKDLVLTNRLRWRADRVAIYGWHRSERDPIQPLSTVHGIRYTDYSHGVRLVSAVAYVDGVARSIVELMSDPWLAGVLSDEGPITQPTLVPASADGGAARIDDLRPIAGPGTDPVCVATALC